MATTRYVTTVTDQNTVPLPDEIRESLNIVPGRELELTVTDSGTVVVSRRELTLEETFGAIPALTDMSHDFDREIEEAIDDALAEKYARLDGSR